MKFRLRRLLDGLENTAADEIIQLVPMCGWAQPMAIIIFLDDFRVVKNENMKMKRWTYMDALFSFSPRYALRGLSFMRCTSVCVCCLIVSFFYFLFHFNCFLFFRAYSGLRGTIRNPRKCRYCCVDLLSFFFSCRAHVDEVRHPQSSRTSEYAF